MHHYARRSNWLPLRWQRRAMNALVPKTPPQNVVISRVEAAGVPGEWITPLGSDPDRVLLYLHGGGYALGSIASHRHFVAKLARHAGMRALLVEYRLAPEHPFPAAVRDARAVWRWLLARGVDPSRAAIAGESAGGGLTMATLLDTRDHGEPLPAAAAVLSPWVDLTLAGSSIEHNDRYDFVPRHVLDNYARSYAGRTDRRHPLLSPVNADLRELPPLLVQVGEVETLYDDARTLHARAADAGVDAKLSIYPDMIHAFMLMQFPASPAAVAEIATHLRQHTGG